MAKANLTLNPQNSKKRQQAEEELKQKEDSALSVKRRQQSTQPTLGQSNRIVIGDGDDTKIVLKPLTTGLSAPPANKQQSRPLSTPERTNSLYQRKNPKKQPMHGSTNEILSENAPLPKGTVAAPSMTIKDHIAQLRLLLQRLFQNTTTNKKLQQQKEAAQQEALREKLAAEEGHKRSRKL